MSHHAHHPGQRAAHPGAASLAGSRALRQRRSAPRYHDSPKRYVNNFGPEFVGLRPDQAELTDLSKRYRIAYHYEKPDKYGNYEVDHSSAVFIFDREGRARLLALSDNTAQQVASDLHRLLASS